DRLCGSGAGRRLWRRRFKRPARPCRHSGVAMSTTTMPALSHLPAIGPGSPAPAAGLPAQETKSGGPAYAPLMLAGGGYGTDAFQSLGLRRPNASGDVAALL